MLTKYNLYIKKLKADIYFQKWKWILWILISILIVLLVLFGIRKMDPNWITENTALFGVMGTLIGALIGGFLSLMGSFWMNTQQQRAKENIRKRDVIYCPLYDELANIQEHILKEHPYPRQISFKYEKEPQVGRIPSPQFSEWERIKSDSRFLEIPEELKVLYEELIASVKDYIKVRQKVDDEIEKNIRETFEEYKINLPFIGSTPLLYSYMLLDENTDIYDNLELSKKEDISDEVRSRINQSIYSKCDNNSIIIDTRKKYDTWMTIQQRTLELLSLLICRVNSKYKG